MRSFTLILAALLFAGSILVSCGEAADSSPAQTTAAVTEQDLSQEETAEPGREDTPDSLPDDLDFEGAVYNILTQDTPLSSISAANEMVADELNGEVINDAVYNRALSVMNRLNVNITKTAVSDIPNTLKKSVQAGDAAYDIAAGYAYYITPSALNHIFVNWLNIPYIDFSQPWWPKTFTDDLIINNTLYFITGDISMRLLEYTYCIYFNKAIAGDYSVPELYPMVLDGKWTIDRYMEVGNMVSSDLNGDGKFDTEDLYGTMNNHYCDTRWSSYDLHISKTTDEGTLELDIMNDKFVDVYTRFWEYYHENDHVYTHKDDQTSLKMFRENHLLMYPYLIVAAENFRDMETDYGIVPYPKYDEAQEQYYCLAHDNYSLMCVPVDVPVEKHEMIGAVTEAFAAESYRTVTPAYLEVAMKNKFLRDEYSTQMLDLVVGGLKFDPAGIYSNSLGDVLHLFRGVWDGKLDIVSIYSKKEKNYLKKFATFNEKYNDM